MVSVRYDKYSAHKRAEQIKACFSMGVVGETLPDAIHRAKVDHVQVLLHLATVNSVFLADGRPDRGPKREFSEGMEEAILDRMDQQRKWIEHYNACLRAYKEGQKKKEACLKALTENVKSKGFNLKEFSLPALLTLANVFNTNTGASLASGLASGELKSPEEVKLVIVKTEPEAKQETKQQHNNGSKKSSSDTIVVGSDRKMTKEEYLKRRQKLRAEGKL